MCHSQLADITVAVIYHRESLNDAIRQQLEASEASASTCTMEASEVLNARNAKLRALDVDEGHSLFAGNMPLSERLSVVNCRFPHLPHETVKQAQRRY